MNIQKQVVYYKIGISEKYIHIFLKIQGMKIQFFKNKLFIEIYATKIKKRRCCLNSAIF